MRPPEKQGEVIVLDTLVECELVLSALDDPSVPKEPIGPSLDDFANSTAARFYRQTQHEPHPPSTVNLFSPAFVESVWNTNPEFRVLEGDVDFVRLAAERALAQKVGLLERLSRRPSERRLAAESIKSFLDSAEL